MPRAVEEEEEGGWVRQQRESREKMQLLVSAFSNSQQDQYEVFRRSSFPKSSVKKIMQVLLQSRDSHVTLNVDLFDAHFLPCRLCVGHQSHRTR